jgi:hypothetical protein
MKRKLMSAGIFLFSGSQHSVQAALSVERSVIFNEGEKSGIERQK